MLRYYSSVTFILIYLVNMLMTAIKETAQNDVTTAIRPPPRMKATSNKWSMSLLGVGHIAHINKASILISGVAGLETFSMK